MPDWLKLTPNLIVGKDQPSTADLQGMAELGYRTVVDLRVTGEGTQPLPPDAEGEAVRRFGMTYRHLPLSAGIPDRDTLDRLHSELARLPEPIFVHCASGKRSGMVALMHRAINEKRTGEWLLAQAREHEIAFPSDDINQAYARYVDHKVAPQFAPPPR